MNCIQLFITELDSALTYTFREVMYLKQALFNRQMSVRSFALMQKNQKIKAYTPEATNSHRSAKISGTRFAQTAEISLRSARNLLYASYVRPILPILYMV